LHHNKSARAIVVGRKLAKGAVLSFIDDEAISRGAAIAFYTVTSIAPVLLIVIAVAGLAFGRKPPKTQSQRNLAA
jgi:uncharacterized BrkB/YihY/UPF0761 family membrane protein